VKHSVFHTFSLIWIPHQVRDDTEIILFLELKPEMISIFDFATLKCSAKSLITRSLALPFSGTSLTEIISPPSTDLIPSFLAFVFTLTEIFMEPEARFELAISALRKHCSAS
jgi:hypothetical protein